MRHCWPDKGTDVQHLSILDTYNKNVLKVIEQFMYTVFYTTQDTFIERTILHDDYPQYITLKKVRLNV